MYSEQNETSTKSPAELSTEKLFEALREMIPMSENSFLVRVADNAMLFDGITKGSTLVVDPEIDCENGSLAVLRYRDEYIVRRVQFQGTAIELAPYNAGYEVMRMDRDEVEILGVPVFLMRRFP